MLPLDKVSDSLSVSQEEEENYRLSPPNDDQVNVIISLPLNIEALQGK